MKLIANGEIGIYIDADYVSTLTTPALIEEELNNVVLGNYDPVVRENKKKNRLL